MTKAQEMLELARSLRARRIMCDGGNGNVYDIADPECEQAAEIIERLAAQADAPVEVDPITSQSVTMPMLSFRPVDVPQSPAQPTIDELGGWIEHGLKYGITSKDGRMCARNLLNRFEIRLVSSDTRPYPKLRT